MNAAAIAGARIELLRQALALEPKSGTLRAELARALLERGDYAGAAPHVRRLFSGRPYDAALDVLRREGDGPDDWARLHERLTGLIRHGAPMPWVLDRYLPALAALGRRAEMDRLLDFARLFIDRTLAAPEGFDDFHAQLEAEIRQKLVWYDAPRNWSIRRAWRHNNLFATRTPAIQALAAQIRTLVADYASGLAPDPSHPHIAARPERSRLTSWAVIGGPDSHHVSHTHPRGWITGVYYVAAPPEAADPTRRLGWLRVGRPESAACAPPGEARWVEPRPGRVVVMPGYFPHETRPTGLGAERICVVFDLNPR